MESYPDVNLQSYNIYQVAKGIGQLLSTYTYTYSDDGQKIVRNMLHTVFAVAPNMYELTSPLCFLSIGAGCLYIDLAILELLRPDIVRTPHDDCRSRNGEFADMRLESLYVRNGLRTFCRGMMN